MRFALSQGRNYVPVLACSLISLGAWGQSADDLLSKASARYGQAGGVSVEFAVHSRVGGGEESFAGRLRMQGDKFALSTPELYIWYDGRVQWTYWVQNEEVMVSEPTEVELQATNPAVILRDRKGYRAKLVKEEVSPGGRAGCVIELVPIKQAAGEGAASVITVRMEKSPPLPYQIEVKTLSGAVTRIGLQSLKPLGGDTVFRFERSKYPSASVIDLR
ncbi:MAG: hypothetical protein LBT73_02735 [Tannerellaceae bacterium]|nr:hypothetical protein [Tannerellaceae bacterium]